MSGRSQRRGYARLSFVVVALVVAILVYWQGGLDLAREMYRTAKVPLPPAEVAPAAVIPERKKAALVKAIRKRAAESREFQEAQKSVVRALNDFAR